MFGFALLLDFFFFFWGGEGANLAASLRAFRAEYLFSSCCGDWKPGTQEPSYSEGSPSGQRQRRSELQEVYTL